MSDPQGAYMQIGLVAARTQLSIRTVRHYDEVGLVTPSARSAGGFRLYAEADVERLLLIRQMQPLGFTLAEMKDLLSALEVLNNPNTPAAERNAAAQRLREYRTKTEHSAERLREQLEYAKDLSGLLAEHAEAKAGTGRRS